MCMKFRLFVFFLLLIFSSCREEHNLPADIPFQFVHEEINLNSIQYQELWNPGGYIYIPNAGYKGIIVINQGGAYKAFERACTYDPRESCSLVEMDDSQLFFIDRCCKSTFTLDGIPSGGPASVPLVEYKTIRNGDFLTIVNE